MEEIVDDANMDAAWRRVKANRGAPGPDGFTVDTFLENFRHQWPEVRRQLLEGTYKPTPVRRKSIPKPDGGERQLGIPVPDPIMSAIAEHARTSGYEDVNEFVSEFILRLSERQTEVERLAVDGLQSGPSEPWNGNEIEAIRAELKSKHGK